MSGYEKIVARRFGGPEVLKLEQLDHLPQPGAGEARLRVEAAGVGYTDTILRRGRYVGYTGGLPLTPGYDVVGVIDSLGSGDIGTHKVGDRVAGMPIHGAYSQYLVCSAASLIPVPAGVDPTDAIEVPLMWATAWQMLTRVTTLPAGASILVVGASGSTGRALVILGRHLGLHVVGTCSSANIPFVKALGAEPIDHQRADLLQAILAASSGKGVSVAFYAIGGASWDVSWRGLAVGGTLVGYGFQDFLESGAPGSEAARLMTQFHETWNADGQADGTQRKTTFYDVALRRQSCPDDYRSDVEHLFGLMATGAARPPGAETLPLSQAAEAHRRIARGGLQHRLVLRP